MRALARSLPDKLELLDRTHDGPRCRGRVGRGARLTWGISPRTHPGTRTSARFFAGLWHSASGLQGSQAWLGGPACCRSRGAARRALPSRNKNWDQNPRFWRDIFDISHRGPLEGSFRSRHTGGRNSRFWGKVPVWISLSPGGSFCHFAQGCLQGAWELPMVTFRQNSTFWAPFWISLSSGAVFVTLHKDACRAPRNCPWYGGTSKFGYFSGFR